MDTGFTPNIHWKDSEFSSVFYAIAENANDYITITNNQWVILYISPSFKSKLGYQSNEMIGKNYLHFIAEESKVTFEEKVKKQLMQVGKQCSITLEHVANDGEIVYTHCKIINVCINDSDTLKVIIAKESLDSITERLEYLAYHDGLTTLPNRHYLEKIFPKLKANADLEKKSVAILYIDGDNFKEINDRYGHKIGDMFLRNFAIVLETSVRSKDTVVRLGGDEFVILLTELSRNPSQRKTQLEQIIKRVQQNLKSGWTVGEYYFSPTSSIGISFYPDNGTKLDELLALSDQALYEIKTAGKNSYKIYDSIDE